MADIELVIKIPEEMYQKIKEANMVIGGRRSGRRFDYILFNAVNTGTPLPKGHGRLKDADAMINMLRTEEASEFFGSVTCAEIMDFIGDEKTIIEADKAESEEE